MRRLALVVAAVIALVAVSISTALARWPTSCVELNDLIEAGRGNHENVGVYERVHGDRAEAVCRSEHRDSGFQFGVRPYQLPSKSDPAAYTQAFVERAIHRYNTDGLQATLDYYNSPQSIDGQWYVFVFDENDMHIANAANPHLVPLPAEDVRGPDGFPTGLHVVAAATDEGAWVDYTWVNPESGDSQTKHSWAVRHDGLVFGSGWYEPGPSKSEPAAYSQALVERAIDLYVNVGRDVTVDYYSSSISLDGPWYAFIIDVEDGLTIAHYRPESIGRDPDRRVDVTGHFYGDDLLAADENGRWVTYVHRNPETGVRQTKHTWAVLHDGLIFGSGWYDPGPSRDDAAGYTREFVQRAIYRYEAEGRQATLDYYNSPQSIDGPWYVFILQPDLNTLAHAARPERVGNTPGPPVGPPRIDLAGKRYDPELFATDESGHWVDYVFYSPASGGPERKHTWIIRHDGLLFGSGWYEPISRDDDPALFTKAFVQRALNRYNAEGRQATIDYYNNAESVDGQWYVFIINVDDGLTIGHYRPEIRGRDPSLRVDVTGYFYGDDLLAADEEGRWVSYVFLNPETGEQQTKHTWAVRHDGLIFASGWYEPGFSNAQLAAFTQTYVEQAIAMYDRDGWEATFDYYGSPESTVDRWYLFIIDPEADALILHPNPSLLGAKSTQRRDSRGYAYGAEMLKTTEEGQWVSYYYRTYDGETAVEEGQKHTWLVLHDGLLFASGWYENVILLPTKEDDPAGFTQWFVQDAVDVHDVNGLDALLERYNDPASIDGEWYVYVLDLDGTILAHAAVPELRGQNIQGPAGVDIAGNRFGPKLLEVTEEGGWITSYFLNPDGADCELKHSWAVRRGEIIIGSGWYEDAVSDSTMPSKCEPADYTVATVEGAIARYRAEGREAAIAYHSSMDSVDGRWYVFIIDAASGVVLAHPASVYIGQSLLVGSEAYGDAGYFYARDLVKATEEGAFVPNVIGVPTMDEQNPFHTIEEVKHYYAVLEDGLIFVSGWYTTPPTPDDPAEYARLLVGRALTRYDDQGLDATLAHYNSPESADGRWYVFILEDRDGDLYTVAHATRPDLVGTTRQRIDANGYNYGEALAAVTEEGGGEWVSYLFTHPQTREDASKHSWVVRRGNLLFGAGWYEGI